MVGFFFMLNYFWIMFGGALGTGARFWASGLVAERLGETFPLGTLFVNITGSFVIGFFEQHRVVGAWCELRSDYRHFRLDRIAAAAATGERAPRRRHAMLKEWRERMDEEARSRREAAARN